MWAVGWPPFMWGHLHRFQHLWKTLSASGNIWKESVQTGSPCFPTGVRVLLASVYACAMFSSWPLGGSLALSPQPFLLKHGEGRQASHRRLAEPTAHRRQRIALGPEKTNCSRNLAERWEQGLLGVLLSSSVMKTDPSPANALVHSLPLCGLRVPGLLLVFHKLDPMICSLRWPASSTWQNILKAHLYWGIYVLFFLWHIYICLSIYIYAVNLYDIYDIETLSQK